MPSKKVNTHKQKKPPEPDLSEYFLPPSEGDFLVSPPAAPPDSFALLESPNFESLLDPATRQALEGKILKTFIRTLDDPSANSQAKVTSAREIGDLLKKYAPKSSNGPKSILSDPDASDALIAGLKQAKNISSGSKSTVKPLTGGKGI